MKVHQCMLVFASLVVFAVAYPAEKVVEPQPQSVAQPLEIVQLVPAPEPAVDGAADETSEAEARQKRHIGFGGVGFGVGVGLIGGGFGAYPGYGYGGYPSYGYGGYPGYGYGYRRYHGYHYGGGYGYGGGFGHPYF
ncbi:RNA-binding protein squid-like [Anopheles darlingi]|uniref:RNA-binding protein squid-like n=1 Tax=Anopheles darlingi TaxID=43151 RepID=UPI0021001A2D|nr:RNA-binding protein squid-like [Anopheles darlingi]